MLPPLHIAHRTSCPTLPFSENPLRPSDIKHLRQTGGQDAYMAALLCAQSLWLQGLPAQALLQLNHALATDITPQSTLLQTWPLPYQAKVWILQHYQASVFIGNPVRHYQHLATRVSGPRKELRSWRAWACFHLAERTLPEADHPRDQKQITQEKLMIPSWQDTLKALERLGIEGESHLLNQI